MSHNTTCLVQNRNITQIERVLCVWVSQCVFFWCRLSQSRFFLSRFFFFFLIITTTIFIFGRNEVCYIGIYSLSPNQRNGEKSQPAHLTLPFVTDGTELAQSRRIPLSKTRTTKPPRQHITTHTDFHHKRQYWRHS